MIAALAFLRLEDVNAGFDELSEILPSPECDDIYRYFKENYLRIQTQVVLFTFSIF